jgi:hypothetical protein
MPWKKLLIGLIVMGVVSGALRGATGRATREERRQRFTEGVQRFWDAVPESSPPKRFLADLEAIRANTERMVELLETERAQRP